MMRLWRKYKEIILYLTFGVLTTICNLSFFYLFHDIFYFHYLFANMIAWILSVLFAFFTNRKYVFASNSDNIVLEFIKFVSCRLISGGFDMFFMFVGVDILHFETFITKLLTNVFVVVLNYIFSKMFIFKEDK